MNFNAEIDSKENRDHKYKIHSIPIGFGLVFRCRQIPFFQFAIHIFLGWMIRNSRIERANKRKCVFVHNITTDSNLPYTLRLGLAFDDFISRILWEMERHEGHSKVVCDAWVMQSYTPSNLIKKEINQFAALNILKRLAPTSWMLFIHRIHHMAIQYIELNLTTAYKNMMVASTQSMFVFLLFPFAHYVTHPYLRDVNMLAFNYVSFFCIRKLLIINLLLFMKL